MNLKRFLTLGSLASVAPIVEFASRFGRTIILSRLMSPAEFGIGVALTVVIGIAELVTDIGFDRFMMSRPRDDDREVLASMHKLQIARGLILSASIFLASPWIAELFGTPNQVWSFRILAVLLLLRSVAHLESKLVQRDFRYGPNAIASTLPHLAVFAAVYPAASLLGDHRAVLVILLVETAVYIIATHALAKTRFSIVTTDRRILREAITFGLPLTVNGIGIAMMGHLDRVLVGNWFGVETLAFYAVLLNLTVLPITGILRIFGVLGMSFLGRAQRNPTALGQLSLILIWVFTVVAAGYAIFTAATIETLAPLLFGRAYTVPPLIAAIVAVMVWLRVSRGAPTIIMLSSGTTGRLMVANLLSGIGLGLAALVLHLLPRLETVFLCVMVGDVASLTTLFWGIREYMSGRLRLIGAYQLVSIATTLLAASSVWIFPLTDILGRTIMFGCAALAAGVQALYGLRRYFMTDTGGLGVPAKGSEQSR